MKTKNNILVLIFLVIVFSTVFAQSSKQNDLLEKDGTDPVCGMKVKKRTSWVSVHNEKQHGFCSKGCKEKFDKNPEKFIKK